MTVPVQEYESGSPEDQRKFDRWLNTNAVVSSIFAIGVLAMALAAILIPYPSSRDVAAAVSTSVSGE